MSGMALRLNEKYQGPFQRKYAGDSTATPDANGFQPSWKVTDICVDLLTAAGYPADQINIADNPTRIWYGESTKVDDYVLNAAGNIGEYLTRLVRDYLGGFVIFDANAGATDANGLPLGQWTVIYQTPMPTSGQFTPLFNFVTTTPGPTSVSHSLSAYPANTAPIFGRITYMTAPPEFNHFLVTTSVSVAGTSVQGAVESHTYNYDSYQVPNSTNTLDPSHPDYLGYERLMILPVQEAAGLGVQQAQQNCDFLARRFLDFAGHAQRTANFTVPLVFITDSSGGYRRPLRFQDPISINGDASWLVKGCHAHYVKDGFQLAEIEAVQPIARQIVQPGITQLSFFRNAQAQHARHSTGAGTHSQRFARRAVPSHREQSIMELPRLTQYQTKLQDNNGVPHYMAAYDPAP